VKFALAFHPLVRADLLEAFAWYEEQAPELGDGFLAEAAVVLRRLAQEPMVYRTRFVDIRRLNLRRFPYGIFYFVEGRKVVVLGVLHGARDSQAELARRREAYF
jgi:plasmid stabilization system protein ParE